jgi:DNA polymerase III alpha subunit
MGFAELSITSNFTFLTGGSHPEDYARRAALLGIEAIAIADVNSVAGVVRAWSELKKIADEIADRAEAMKDPIGPPKPAHLPDPPRARIDHIPRLLPASCLHLSEGLRITALPRDRTGWGSLCRVLSVGRLRAEKGELPAASRRPSGSSQGVGASPPCPRPCHEGLAPRRHPPDTGAGPAGHAPDGAVL